MSEVGTFGNPQIIVKPTGKAREQALRFEAAAIPGVVAPPGTTAPPQINDVVVVSGYAGYAEGWLSGAEDDDEEQFYYLCELNVGPRWWLIHDVSPSVAITGMNDTDPDEVDAQSHGVNKCTWEVVGENAPKRIRLKVELFVAGGWTTSVTKLAYHLVATGGILEGKDTDEYFAQK